jgi:hypothetical protein
MEPIKPNTKSIGNEYILAAIDYITKWVEAKTLKNNIVQNITKL